MNTPPKKISVIVPVYNVEKYLAECVDSVLAQTFSDFELLLIDDGSKDGSGAICDEYAAKDNRVRVFHKENGGQPSALNYGLDVAKGEFVMFLDSDDFWCDYQILEKLIQKIEQNNLDIIRAECQEVDNNGVLLKKYTGGKYKNNYCGRVVDSLFFLDKLIAQTYFMVVYLIRKSIIGNLRYNETRVFLQDAEFCVSLCSKPLICMYVDDIFYAYRKHENAITVKPHPQKLYDAFGFSRFCFSLVDDVQEKGMKKFLVNEGIRNLLYDIHVLAESSRNAAELKKAFYDYSIHKLKSSALNLSFRYSFNLKRVLLLSLPFLYHIRILRFKMRLVCLVKSVLY